MRILAAISFICVSLWSTLAAAQQNTNVSTNNETIVIPAGTVWNSPTKIGEACSFDLKIQYNEVFETTTFDDGHQVMHIQIKDNITNLKSGFSFFDTADYFIRLDTSLVAFHAGTFWKTTIHGELATLDFGTFEQDWKLWNDEPPPAFNLTGDDHDINAVTFNTWSYCDWAQGNFPRLQVCYPGKKHCHYSKPHKPPHKPPSEPKN